MVSTLFVFCINPSIKVTVLSIYKGRIYAKVTNNRGLPAAVNEKVVMRFIVICKLMARYLLLLHFA